MIQKYKMEEPFPSIHDCVVSAITFDGNILELHYENIEMYDAIRRQGVTEKFLTLSFVLNNYDPHNEEVEIESYKYRKFLKILGKETNYYYLSDFVKLFNKNDIRIETLDIQTNGDQIFIKNAYNGKHKCNMYLNTNEAIFDWHN